MKIVRLPSRRRGRRPSHLSRIARTQSSYPSITIVAPYAARGSLDVTARTLAEGFVTRNARPRRNAADVSRRNHAYCGAQQGRLRSEVFDQWPRPNVL